MGQALIDRLAAGGDRVRGRGADERLARRQAIDAANAVFGRHPGYRALHAKGTLLKGTFTATPEAARADARRRTCRASRSRSRSGSPTAAATPTSPTTRPTSAAWRSSSTCPTARGPTSSRQTVAALPGPHAGGVRRVHARAGPGPRRWRGGCRRSSRVIPGALATLPGSLGAPAARELRDHPSTTRSTRSGSWTPTAARGTSATRSCPRPATRASARGRPSAAAATTSRRSIRERVERGAVRFTLELQIAEPGDPVDDPSAAWPAERRARRRRDARAHRCSRPSARRAATCSCSTRPG